MSNNSTNPNMPFSMNPMYNNFSMQQQMNHMHINPMFNNQMGNIEPPKKEKLRVKLTQEERGYYSSLFQIADKDSKGKLVGKEAADFLKKSGLSKDTLKFIWILSAQVDPQGLEKDEFYIALRLVALAQNNMECSEDSIRLNHPLPPMPRFDLKNSSSLNSSSILDQSVNMDNSQMRSSVLNNSVQDDFNFLISEDDLKKYTALFTKNKDLENKLSINKAFQMWTVAGVPNDTLKKILTICPLNDKTCLNFNEFKVIFHLIYKSSQVEIPSVLPTNLKKILTEATEQNNNDVNFNAKLNIDTQSNSSNPFQQQQFNQPLNPTQMSISIPNTQKKADIETLLMNEFNIKNNNSFNNEALSVYTGIPNNDSNKINPTNENRQIEYKIKNQDLKVESNLEYKPLSNEISNISRNVNETFNNMQKEAIAQNQYLTKLMDEDRSLLITLGEEVDRVTANINMINEKNKYLKDQIMDLRRKINFEKDNLVKSNLEYSQKVNELITNNEEFNKLKQEYNDLKLESSSISRSTQKPIVENKLVSNNKPPQNTFEKVPEPIIKNVEPKVDVKQNNYNEVKQNNFKENTHNNANNKSFDVAFNDSENNFSKKKFDAFDKFEASNDNLNHSSIGKSTFNFDNALSNPSNNQNNSNQQQSKIETYPSFNSVFYKNTESEKEKESSIKKMNTDFNFDNFDGGMSSFKDFAEKKGDDFFNQDVKWDDF